ncbi:MAG: bifunctional heptose 7-phosphate kinase/heptose 1-phosphate adenyltransferase [Candidatus Hodarchaeota archaeon]
MSLIDNIKDWNQKKVLIIGEALVDKYIFGFADSISPDAPVPNIKIENSSTYIGAIGLVLQFIKSLGGIPEVCTLIGNDFEGDFFLKNIKKLNIDSSSLIVEDDIKTPQITRIKAMNQHLLRLETDYNTEISSNITKRLIDAIGSKVEDVASILILDYGTGGLFKDLFIQNLLNKLSENSNKTPIIVRPTKNNYYLYEKVDFIKMNLQKALDTFSIDCCTETSILIAGRRILNASKCKNLLLNYLELDSYLFFKEQEKIEKFKPILRQPVRSYVAVGSVIMAVLGLSLASKIPVVDAVRIALSAAAYTASLPPVDFFSSKRLSDYIKTITN